MDQTLYPSHCVQDTWGANIADGLKVPESASFVYKGFDSEVGVGRMVGGR